MIKERYVAIIIPMYKEKLTAIERISLEQAINVLDKYDIYFVMPESLNRSTDYTIYEERFCDKYFQSISAYNDLMLNKEFYERFSGYEYILIYQLDAFVFSDKLMFFCDLGYDYIGAPWIHGSFYYYDSEHTIWHVGNGGLSLRRVKSCLQILKTRGDMLRNNKMNEDLFFAVMDGDVFHVAPIEIALQFSFEMNVRECYAQNKEQLPFGCHAWHKFDLPFWKPWIETYGYEIPEKMCAEGQEDTNYLMNVKKRSITDFWQKKYRKEELRALFIKLFSSENGCFAIWGAGYWGQILCRMMDEAEVIVSMFIDRGAELEGIEILGHDVISPERLIDINKIHIVIAVTKGYQDITEFLENIGYHYQKDYIYLRDIDFVCKNVLM